MKKRNIVFHGTHSELIESILREGIESSHGVYGYGVYTTKSPHKSLEKSGGDAVIIINPRGYEHSAYIPTKKDGREKDWMIFEDSVSPKNIIGIIEIKEREIIYRKRDGAIEEFKYNSENEKKRIIGDITRILNDEIYNPICLYAASDNNKYTVKTQFYPPP